MEGHALAQGEAHGAVVGPLPGGGQLADQLVGRRIAVEQRLEDVAQDGVAVQAVGVPVLERAGSADSEMTIWPAGSAAWAKAASGVARSAIPIADADNPSAAPRVTRSRRVIVPAAASAMN